MELYYVVLDWILLQEMDVQLMMENLEVWKLTQDIPTLIMLKKLAPHIL